MSCEIPHHQASKFHHWSTWYWISISLHSSETDCYEIKGCFQQGKSNPRSTAWSFCYTQRRVWWSYSQLKASSRQTCSNKCNEVYFWNQYHIAKDLRWQRTVSSHLVLLVGERVTRHLCRLLTITVTKTNHTYTGVCKFPPMYMHMDACTFHCQCSFQQLLLRSSGKTYLVSMLRSDQKPISAPRCSCTITQDVTAGTRVTQFNKGTEQNSCHTLNSYTHCVGNPGMRWRWLTYLTCFSPTPKKQPYLLSMRLVVMVTRRWMMNHWVDSWRMTKESTGTAADDDGFEMIDALLLDKVFYGLHRVPWRPPRSESPAAGNPDKVTCKACFENRKVRHYRPFPIFKNMRIDQYFIQESTIRSLTIWSVWYKYLGNYCTITVDINCSFYCRTFRP